MNIRKLATRAIAVGAVLAPALVMAQTAPDASDIVTTAQTTFNSVGAVVAAAVGFFIVVKIVKWVRK